MCKYNCICVQSTAPGTSLSTPRRVTWRYTARDTRDTVWCFLPEWPEAWDMRPLCAGLQLRSISTMAAVHSVMITGDPLRRIENIFLGCIGTLDLGVSATAATCSASVLDLRPSLRSLCPPCVLLCPRWRWWPWLLAPCSSPEDRSSSSDKVSLPRLFLDLKNI